MAELNIINGATQVSPRPYLLIELAQVNEPTSMKLTTFDLGEMDFDRRSVQQADDPLDVNVELLGEQPYWLNKDTLPFVDRTRIVTEPIRLQPYDEVKVKVALFMPSFGLARTGAGFMDKESLGLGLQIICHPH